LADLPIDSAKNRLGKRPHYHQGGEQHGNGTALLLSGVRDGYEARDLTAFKKIGKIDSHF
jgi:hypothetical protein